jgi:hypothetical protein
VDGFSDDFETDCYGLQRQGTNFVYPSSYLVQPGATPIEGMEIMDFIDIHALFKSGFLDDLTLYIRDRHLRKRMSRNSPLYQTKTQREQQQDRIPGL